MKQTYLRGAPLLGICLFASMPSTAHADDQLVQNGHWSCSFPSYESTGPFNCPRVSFPKIFGATPTVTFVNGPIPTGQVIVSRYDNVTADGFTPILFRGGGRGAKSGQTVGGDFIAVGQPQLIPGTVSPRYVVLTVVYAPPGTNGGKSTSSVTYAAGSTTGSTVSSENSFKQAYSVAVDSGAGLIGNGGGAGLSFTYSLDSTNGQSTDIKKSATTTITRPGPAVDGIDHGRDVIYIWLNPTLNLSLNSSRAVWSFTGSGIADIQFLYVSWLLNPSCHEDSTHLMCLPDNMRDKLTSYGITEADYAQILAHDPLASGATVMEPTRYQSLNSTFAYEPPVSPTDPVILMTFNQTNASTSTNTSTVVDDYKVELSVHGEGSYFDLVKASVKATGSWEWTNKATNSTSNGATETASVTIGGPSYGYPGSTDMEIFYDVIYKTFAFAPFVGPPATLSGTLQSSDDKPAPGAVISITSGNTVYHTITNAKGEWHIHAIINGTCSIGVNGGTKQINDCGQKSRIVLSSTDFVPSK